jgi:hypothetical protein
MNQEPLDINRKFQHVVSGIPSSYDIVGHHLWVEAKLL